MARYVALLPGINVGGRNLIGMPALRACFEAGGFTDVRTYIQSGNVVFGSSETRAAVIIPQIEAMLADTFDYPASIVLRSRAQVRAVVGRVPKGFESKPAAYRYDVIYLKEPLRAKTAIQSVQTRPGVDEAVAGTGVLYFSRLVSRASQSRLSTIVASPLYPSITIRNWNTTTALLRLLEPEQPRG